MFSALLAAALLTNQPDFSYATSSLSSVPFYSQFKDISSSKWQKVGCGIASLAMVVDYYSTTTVSVNKLLAQGIAAGAYSKAGWTYSGLIAVGKKYGMTGSSYDLGKMSASSAFAKMKEKLIDGPVIASVHYKFDPKNPIPHLVVITNARDGVLYYNDPAAKDGGRKIAVEEFLAAWKKRFIVIRPASENNLVAKAS